MFDIYYSISMLFTIILVTNNRNSTSMKKLLILIVLLSANLNVAHAQTEVNGTIVSVNGEQIPVATIDVSAIGPTDIFTLPDKEFADEDGEFSVSFSNPGINSLTIRGVFHKTVSIPLMIYDQEKVSMSVYLVPVSYNDGKYFDIQAYLRWIRVFGNFNDYDFFSGEIFRANDDGSISAFIKTDLDTIRYQVRGLTNGIAVLPGADDYAALGSNFEAILYKVSDADSVEIRFHPNETQPYSHAYTNSPATRQIPISAFVHFKDYSDKFWSIPLQRVQTSRISYQPIEKPAYSGIPENILKEARSMGYDFLSTKRISSFRDSVIKDLNENNLHPQQTSALLISYVGLVEQQRSRQQYLERTGREPQAMQIDDNIFDRIFNTVDPRNPVWALNHDAPLVLLEETGYSSDAVAYAERMIRQHANDMVVRNLVLRLIERRAGDFESIKEMPYYNWIVDRYGENNLARRAILAFHRVNKSR